MSALYNEINDSIIDWNLVLNLREVRDYLTKLDKLELSQVNKVFRYKLKPKLFKIIRYGLKPDDLEVIDCAYDKSDTINQDYNKKFNDNFKNLNNYFVELNLYRFFNVYSLLPISLTFNNLQFVQIFKLCIPLRLFKSSLENLKKLRALWLNEVTIVQFQNDNVIGPLLSLPNAFNDLNLSDCYLIKSKLDSDPFKVSYNYGRQVLSKDYLHLLDHQFPNLKSYSIIGYKHAISSMLSSFLAKHPLINKLKITTNLLNQQTLNLISELSILRDLSLEDLGVALHLQVQPTYNIRYFNYITYQPQFNWKIIEFYTSMSNLTSLTMNYYKNFIELMEEIFRGSPNLEKLKVFNNYGGDLEFDQIPNNQLKTLELLNFKQKSLNTQIFANSPSLIKLKIYKISHKYSLIGIKYSKFTNDLNIDKYLKFNNYRDYYQISVNFRDIGRVIEIDRIYLNLHYFGEFNN